MGPQRDRHPRETDIPERDRHIRDTDTEAYLTCDPRETDTDLTWDPRETDTEADLTHMQCRSGPLAMKVSSAQWLHVDTGP